MRFEEGDHYDDVDEAQLPYTLIRNLGSGGYGVVSEVKDSNTDLVYALKVCVPTRRDKDRKKEMFKNELAILKSLKQHGHIIHLFATYTTKTSFGMIMTPVADGGDLYKFLGDFMDYKENPSGHLARMETMIATLKRAFGCLAEGLSFMRYKRIRNKDIKTRNILIHRGIAIYTDFGFSVDSSLCDDSKSFGPAEMTKRYAAPEVIDGKFRDSSSDVFSLGCVYIEILSALCPDVVYDERQAFSAIMPSIHEQIGKANNIPADLKFILDVIKSMTAPHPEARCSSEWISGNIATRIGFSCEQCRSKDITTSTNPQMQEPDQDSEPAHEKPQPWISIDEDSDYVISSADQLPFRVVRVLGSGHIATVTEVIHIVTAKSYARKCVRFSHRRYSREGTNWLQNESNTLRRLSKHHHIVKLFASYALPDLREIGLVLRPVADGRDLKYLLYNYKYCYSKVDQLKDARNTLERAFGCLASGLAYMHANFIRHTNIKPNNILLHKGNLLYSGFGHSQDFSLLNGSSTDSPIPFSRRYAAPEILDHRMCNISSDVFSLGCVFLEIMTALNSQFHVSPMAMFAQEMDNILHDLATALLETQQRQHFLQPVIVSMTRRNRHGRSTAAEIATTIASQPGLCCTKCQDVTYEHVD
jgi:serine/threonine protein kinase